MKHIRGRSWVIAIRFILSSRERESKPARKKERARTGRSSGSVVRALPGDWFSFQRPHWAPTVACNPSSRGLFFVAFLKNSPTRAVEW